MKLTPFRYPDVVFGSDFRRLLRDAFECFDGLGAALDRPLRGSAAPAADLYASEDAYHVRVELPGVAKENVKISLENSVLSVNATLEEGEGDTRRHLTLSRAIAVPDDVDVTKIEAKLENGLLTLSLPKQEERKARQIQIQ